MQSVFVQQYRRARIGIACCILILLYVQDEVGFDRFHQNAEQIYRVMVNESNESRVRQRASSFMPMTLAIALLTVSFQAIRAALTNPVEALRYE